MKIDRIKPTLSSGLLRLPSRRRLVARSTYPRVSRLWVSPGPLRRLAWIFGFGLNH